MTGLIAPWDDAGAFLACEQFKYTFIWAYIGHDALVKLIGLRGVFAPWGQRLILEHRLWCEAPDRRIAFAPIARL